MNGFTLIRRLGPVDAKNIRRDALLVWIPALLVVVALIYRLATPPLTQFLQTTLGFDLTPYYPLLMSSFILTAATLVGMVTGFLLLDERDDRTLLAMMVTPLRFSDYLLYRVSLPILFGLVMTLATYPLAGLTPLPFVDLLIVSTLGALSGPQIALFLATFAANKVSGFAVVKVLNALLLLPAVAYFFSSNRQLLAGVIPTYWPMKVLWLAAAGEPYALYAMVGLIVNVLALWGLLRWFNAKAHQ